MLTAEQFEKIRAFIYRQGDLLTRRRFAYHFEGGARQAALDALACYQNEDGGFGNGLELDILCPESSGICTEAAFATMVELGVTEGPVFDRALSWVVSHSTADGDLPHPVEAVKRYPHGEWWAKPDHGRILSIAGLLGKAGKGHPDVSARAAAVFESLYVPFPAKLDVYSGPVNLYLEYADGAEKYAEYRALLRARLPEMLEASAWHHPLFFCSNSWDSPAISQSLWQREAARAVATLQDDGGIALREYADIASYRFWRPIWSLDMLVTMKSRGLPAVHD